MSRLRRLVWGLSLGASSLQVSALVLAMFVGGCASRQSEPQPYAANTQGPQPHVADARAGQEKAKEDVEGDGMPAQLPPVRGRQIPDDPAEPWSPNYGSAKPVRSASAAN